jgi:electron transport complex protein RnfC
MKHTFRHGVHPPDFKELTANVRIRRMPYPDQVVLPLSQHFGAPARLLVRPGDRVERGDMVGAADGFMSSPVHASAAGTIRNIGLWPHPDGTQQTAICVDVEKYSPQVLRPRMIPDWEELSPKEIVPAVHDAGLAPERKDSPSPS